MKKKYCWHQSKKRNMQQQVDDVQSDEDINWMRNKFIIQWWRKMTGVSKTDGVKHDSH